MLWYRVRMKEFLKNRTILKLLLLIFFTNGWFALSNWVFLFNKYLTPTEIGIIDGVAILIGIIMEVPTGAFADLFGKKVSLIVARIITIFGVICIIYSQSFWMFLLGDTLIFIGFSFHSGSREALTFDTFKELGKENLFDKFLSVGNNIALIMTVFATAIGGFLFSLNQYFPWWAWVVTESISIIVLLFIKEPKIDSEKITLRSYFKKNRDGFIHLFNKNLKPYLILLLPLILIPKMVTGIFRQGIGADFGFNGDTLGYLIAFAFLILSIVILAFEKIMKFLKEINLSFILTLFFTILYFILYFKILGGMLGGGFILILLMILSIYSEVTVSSVVNKNIESTHRATTLSTVSLISNIPYVLIAIFFGQIASVSGINYYYLLMLTFSLLFLIIFLVRYFKNIFFKKSLN